MSGSGEPIPEPRRALNLERYSPVRVSALLHLPESNARTFMVASALGRFLRLDGSSDRLQSAKEASGTLITPKRRAVVLETLDLGLRQWQRLAKDWERRGLAHRCGRGTVFLFTHPHLVECPACGSWIEIDDGPVPSPRWNRGDGFGSTRHDASPRSDMVRRLTRTNASPQGALMRRVLSANELHPTDRSLPRDRSRDGGEVAPQSSQDSVRNRRERDLEGGE